VRDVEGYLGGNPGAEGVTTQPVIGEIVGGRRDDCDTREGSEISTGLIAGGIVIVSGNLWKLILILPPR